MQFTTGSPQDPLAWFAAAKLAVVEAQQELDAAKQAAVEYLQSQKVKSLSREHNGRRQTFTVSRQTKTIVDEQGLRDAVGEDIAEQWYIRKFDKKMLEAALDAGTVDPGVVAPFIDLKEGDPFIVFTESEEEPDAP